jgi:uncharacterized membrane protein YfcA
MIPTAVFLALLCVLWASGVSLFVRAGLTRRRKVVWTLLLVTVGVAVGVVLPLNAIRNRFLFLLLLLPVLALIDIKVARSNRSFLFWFRACSFEISTVFLAATLTRGALEAW